ncbi:TetR family transcriptional regulator [Clostridium sartagoforme AAU1]|uniref:TetR family transcriptional regulator n=1 Tax=Clostridium sartagoforme AAU1 TaxID=1202534 RepID=R9CGR9_9CLOT|nr:TetR family transcriptional regulator [Clostridium sartagoforme]EOR28220.1 TetR family transcriptional regulator [Clostridium sartagoforme AAU1]
MRELMSVEEKILDRALYLIGKNKTMDVPVRAIAKEANVNVSAINYYFRSKEEMLKQVRQFYLTNTESVSLILNNKEYKDDEEKLILAANEIMEYMLRFPGVTVILRDALKNNENDEISRLIINENSNMHKKMEKTLEEITINNKMPLKHKMAIFMASITHTIENCDIMDFAKNIVDTRDERIKFIESIIKVLKAT